MGELKDNFNKACAAYIKAFEEKHDYQFDDSLTSDSDYLDVLVFGDYYFNLCDIVYDIDNDLPENMIFEWSNHNVEQNFMAGGVFVEHKYINLQHYHWGGRL